MFTGVTEVAGDITNREDKEGILRLTITCPTDWQLKLGQSIAVSGACLTVVEHSTGSFVVEVMPETLKRTTFSDSNLKQVNLERAMPADGRFEGHVVQGHVDTIGKIEAVKKSDGSSIWEFSFPAEYQANIVEKGSITIDGVSLTVVAVREKRFTVGLIPHTLNVTTFGQKAEGDAVHLEFDIMGKYIMNKLSHHG